MATIESMAIRCNAALVRLENALRELEGLAPLSPGEKKPIPRVYRDREMLRVMQLEQLADWVERVKHAPRDEAKPKRVVKKRTTKRKAVASGNANSN